MNCRCSSLEYVWDNQGATFDCKECQQIHRMCCAVYKKYLCGEVDGHLEDHQSVVSKINWNNQVYK